MWGTKKHQQGRPIASDQRGIDTPGYAPASGERTDPRTEATALSLAASDRAAARLEAGLQIKGEISGNEDLYVDGNVAGLIRLEGRRLTVGTSAKVTADVVAREVIVYGSARGNLRARDRIEIKKEGSVVGDLITAGITIEDGASFQGSIEIDRNAQAATEPELPQRARPATQKPG